MPVLTENSSLFKFFYMSPKVNLLLSFLAAYLGFLLYFIIFLEVVEDDIVLIRVQVLFVFMCLRLVLIIHFDKRSHFCVKINSAVLGSRLSE